VADVLQGLSRVRATRAGACLHRFRWARFQSDETGIPVRGEVGDALRGYCDPGTPTMVMIYEAWWKYVQ